MEKKFVTASDISEELGVSRSTAYKIIRVLNKELQEKGFLTTTGKTMRKYFIERYNLL